MTKNFDGLSSDQVQTRRSRRRLIIIIAVLCLVVALAVVTALLVYRGWAGARDRERFREEAERNWKKLQSESEKLAAALGRVASPSDLEAVADAAREMRTFVGETKEALEKDTAPPGYEEVSGKQKGALADIDTYLQNIEDLAGSGDEEKVQDGRGVLENASRRALSSVNEFLAEAPFVNDRPVAEFYQAGSALIEAWQPPPYAGDAETEAVFDGVTDFLEADIEDQDFNKIFSMISSRLKTGFEFYKVTQEDLVRNWRKSWGDDRPVDFYVRKSDISFPEPDRAVVKVIVYMEDGPPRSGEMRLVEEEGVWKIDSYPFVGWG